jgi:hypothetical protein
VKYGVPHSCGHVGGVEASGPGRDRQRRLAAAFDDPRSCALSLGIAALAYGCMRFGAWTERRDAARLASKSGGDPGESGEPESSSQTTRAAP